jgi:hypothetical protein
MEDFIMQLKNEISNPDELFDLISEWYQTAGRQFRYIASGYVGEVDLEGSFYFVSYLLDKKHLIKYSLPNAIRTIPVISVGIGPEYIPIQWLVDDERSWKISWDQTSGAVVNNLVILDKFLIDVVSKCP